MNKDVVRPIIPEGAEKHNFGEESAPSGIEAVVGRLTMRHTKLEQGTLQVPSQRAALESTNYSATPQISLPLSTLAKAPLRRCPLNNSILLINFVVYCC